MGLSRLAMGLFIIAFYLGGNVLFGLELALNNSLQFNNYTLLLIACFFILKKIFNLFIKESTPI
jgi:hypothetical protein